MVQKRNEDGAAYVCDNTRTALDHKMVVIVRRYPVCCEALAQLRSLPSVDELRPDSCPDCGALARGSDGRLQLVGHGSYQRQVRGRPGPRECLLVWIRRYRCLRCRVTMSVLPDELLPGRIYAAGAILLALYRTLIETETAGVARAQFGAPGESNDWRALSLWQRALLGRLWGWHARQLGMTKPPPDRAQRRHGLLRLLRLHGGRVGSRPGELESIAQDLGRGSVHRRGEAAQFLRAS